MYPSCPHFAHWFLAVYVFIKPINAFLIDMDIDISRHFHIGMTESFTYKFDI